MSGARALALATLVATALVGSGCGSQGDACDQYQLAESLLAGKGAGCGANNSSSSGFNAATCKQKLSECSDTDAQFISAYGGCVDELPNCSSSTQSTWTFAEVNCESDLASVSSGCLKDVLGLP